MIDNTAVALHTAVAAVCPIHGVSIGRKNDKSTWRIDFAPNASSNERAAAEAVLASFDVAAAQAEAAAKAVHAKLVETKMRELAEAMVADPTLFDKFKAAK